MNLRSKMIFAASALAAISLFSTVKAAQVGSRHGAGFAGNTRYVDADRYGRYGWSRPGYGLATGAVVGGAIAASQPYGYADYGYGPGYYGYAPGYAPAYDSGPAVGEFYGQNCTYVGGPKTGTWSCR